MTLKEFCWNPNNNGAASRSEGSIFIRQASDSRQMLVPV